MGSIDLPIKADLEVNDQISRSPHSEVGVVCCFPKNPFVSSVEVDDSFILRLCHDIFSMGFMAINWGCAPLSGHTHILILGETYPIHTTPKKTVAFLTPSRFRAPILLGMNPQGLSHNIQLGMRLDAILWLFLQMVIKHKLYTHARIF